MNIVKLVKHIACIMLIVPAICYAGWDSDPAVQKGQTIQTSQVTVSSSTATQIVFAKSKRVDISIKFENSSYDMYIGSYGVTTANGYPIYSKVGHSFNGLYTGTIYAIMEAGAASTVAYIEELIRN